MLNACSPGVGVVNIDNGFGAAVLAGSLLSIITVCIRLTLLILITARILRKVRS